MDTIRHNAVAIMYLPKYAFPSCTLFEQSIGFTESTAYGLAKLRLVTSRKLWLSRRSGARLQNCNHFDRKGRYRSAFFSQKFWAENFWWSSAEIACWKWTRAAFLRLGKNIHSELLTEKFSESTQKELLTQKAIPSSSRFAKSKRE